MRIEYSKKYYKYAQDCRKKFETLLQKFLNETDDGEKRKLGNYLLHYATYYPVGYFSCKELEDYYLKKAEELEFDENLYNQEPVDNSFLHVATVVYNKGGHTRMIERWIENSDSNSKQSLIILNNENEQNIVIPERLKNAVKNKGGEVICLNEAFSIEQKAKILREVGLKYKYIVLHVHNYDEIPIIAFGTENFKRPVIYFNHSDHMFWAGVSVSDVVADIKEKGFYITKNLRQAKNNYLLYCPVDKKEECQKPTSEIKMQYRKELNIPVDKKIIMSIGAEYKFNSKANIDICDIMNPFIKENKDIEFILIGPNKETSSYWSDCYKKSNGEINAIGYVPNENLYKYIISADVIIDSFPYCGGTTMMDAVENFVPVLTFDSNIGNFDYLLKSCAYCESIEEFYKKLEKLLNEEKYRIQNVSEVRQNLVDFHSIKIWSKRRDEMINMLGKHKINHIKENKKAKLDAEIIDIGILNNCYPSEQSGKFFIKRLLQNIFSVRNSEDRKRKIITILGFKISVKRNK